MGGERYSRVHAGLRLKPSAYGLIEFDKLSPESRATLLGLSPDGRLLLIQRDDVKRVEKWARAFWIPLRGNRQWRVAPKEALALLRAEAEKGQA